MISISIMNTDLMAVMDQEDVDQDRDSGTASEVNPSGSDLVTFGTKPYLSKEGRELLNRAGRQIQRDHPDWCDDPTDPSAADGIKWLKQQGGEFEDDMLLVELLGQGLTAEEAVVWLLWKHSALEPVEIFYAYEGKQTAGRAGVDRQAVRNIKSRIRSAATKLGVQVNV